MSALKNIGIAIGISVLFLSGNFLVRRHSKTPNLSRFDTKLSALLEKSM